MPDVPPTPEPTLAAIMRHAYPEDYRAALELQGAYEASATPAEHDFAAGKVMALHHRELIQMSNSHAIDTALVEKGYVIDPKAREFLASRPAAKRRGVEIDERAVREFAALNYEADNPVKSYEAEVTKAQQHAEDTTFAERFGSPNGG